MTDVSKGEESISFSNIILKSPIYWLGICFISLLSYLFDMVNRTIGIDDLARPFYLEKEGVAISDNRWGMTLIGNLLSSREFTPFIDKFLSVTFLIISAVFFSKILFFYLKNTKTKYLILMITLFSCIYISYPLVNEIWNFNATNLCVHVNALIISFCLLRLHRETKLFSTEVIISSLLLSVAVSSYESSAFFYVTAVCAILLLDNLFFQKKNWFTNGIRYAIPLIIAIVLKFAVSFCLNHILDVSKVQLAGSGINWRLGENIPGQIKNILHITFIDYFMKGLIYLPITIFLISSVSLLLAVITQSIKQKNFRVLFLFLMLFLSLFLQTIIQGYSMPYRCAQMFPFFCAFSITISLYFLSMSDKPTLFLIAFIFSGFICFRQAVFLNKTFSLNNQRSENEAAIAYIIGSKIKEIDSQKPVYITGGVSLGAYIDRQKRPDSSTIGGYVFRKIAIHFGWDYDNIVLYDSNINSVINWNTRAFLIPHRMSTYFSYYGIDANIQEYANWHEHNIYAKEAYDYGLKPFDVRDLGDHILVFLGP